MKKEGASKSDTTLLSTYFGRFFLFFVFLIRRSNVAKKVREKSRECHSYKPQLFPDTKTFSTFKKNKLSNCLCTKSFIILFGLKCQFFMFSDINNG